jgi:hypothetical protein
MANKNVTKISSDEIRLLILTRGLTICDVIDEAIKLNGIIGVGIITLGEQLEQYCLDKIKTGNHGD